MRNLAGDKKEADMWVERELRRARILAVPLDREPGEVPATHMGQICSIDPTKVGGSGILNLRRAWSYWSVEGRVSMQVAWALYNDPVGRDDVRVAGHCGRPAPHGIYVQWFDPGGRPIALQKDLDEMRGVKSLAHHVESFELEHAIAGDEDARARVGTPFVTCYHIDSEVGLRLFADVIAGRV